MYVLVFVLQVHSLNKLDDSIDSHIVVLFEVTIAKGSLELLELMKDSRNSRREGSFQLEICFSRY